jgi:uroporphyrin-III C-methyltransferase
MLRFTKSILRIVGAGPGDPELFTIKGALALQQADVILYDALVNKALLDNYAHPQATLVYVGKRKSKKEFSQDEINELIVFYASKYKNVVRLKGGDPFVFGRGHEEMQFASQHDIEVEVIPGISSAIAAPSAAGIPLTKRGVNQSFWVVTGTLASGEIANDVVHAAQSSATVVILMGITRLEQIKSIFKETRGDDEPVAVIQYATWNEEKIVNGTIGNIVEKVKDAKIDSPAVIVVGKVVNHSLMLKAASDAKSQYIHA